MGSSPTASGATTATSSSSCGSRMEWRPRTRTPTRRSAQTWSRCGPTLRRTETQLRRLSPPQVTSGSRSVEGKTQSTWRSRQTGPRSSHTRIGTRRGESSGTRSTKSILQPCSTRSHPRSKTPRCTRGWAVPQIRMSCKEIKLEYLSLKKKKKKKKKIKNLEKKKKKKKKKKS